MDHDDDVEHLFSWLQTPELRYREFAGAREITDTVVISQQRANNTQVPRGEPVAAPRHDTQLKEEYPEDQFPDRGETRVEMVPETRPATHENDRVVLREEAGVAAPEETARAAVREEASTEPHEDTRGAGRGPVIIAPVAVGEAPEQTGAAGPFALDAEGRRSLRAAEEAGQRPPFLQAPPAAPSPPAAPPPVATSAAGPEAQSSENAPAPSSGLLGGAYRDDGQEIGSAAGGPASPPVSEGQERSERSLDAVFGRLSGGRNRLPDPRERVRHIPGLGPPTGRSR